MDVERFILDPLPAAKEEFFSWPRGGGPLPNSKAISNRGHHFAFGKGLQGAVCLPQQEQLYDWRAPVGPSSTGCPYHPVLLARPALDDANPMCHVYVEEGDVLRTTRPTWLDLGDSGGQEASFLHQYCPPPPSPHP